MIVLGITGGSGSGKTMLLSRVAARGGCAIDCDAVYHALLREDQALLDGIGRRFPGVVGGGALNRKELGKLVFADKAALADLEAIAHPRVTARVRAMLDAAKDQRRPLAALDAVALIESGLGALCTLTVAVTAPLEDRVRRLMLREGIGEDYARLRLSAQKTDAAFAARCDKTIVNDCPSAAAFAARCDAFLDELWEEYHHV